MERAREKREAQGFQMWLASMQANPQASPQVYQRVQAANSHADRNVLVALHNNLPRSVRPLLGLSDMAASVDKVRTTLDHWDKLIEEQPQGSRRRAFMEAGKAATELRMSRGKQERVH